MNIDDIKSDVIPTEGDQLELIFQRQHALMEKYIPIEVKNDLCWTTDCPVNIETGKGQARLKDFFWRTTEELTEAMEAHLSKVGEVNTHTLEELSDSLHFLVEACLLSNINPLDISTGYRFMGGVDQLEIVWNGVDDFTGHKLTELILEVIYFIGCGSNCLKQRPWKQSHQLIDLPKYRGFIIRAFYSLIGCFRLCGLTSTQIFELYWKKSEVNKFRMRSNY